MIGATRAQQNLLLLPHLCVNHFHFEILGIISCLLKIIWKLFFKESDMKFYILFDYEKIKCEILT